MKISTRFFSRSLISMMRLKSASRSACPPRSRPLHRVVGRVDVVVQRRGDLLHLERRQEAVVDAVLERVDVDRLAEVGVGVHVVLALGRGGQAELHGGREVVQDAAPVALVVRAAAMALVDDDEVEEVRRILAEVGRRLAVLGRPAHEGLEDGEEQAAVLRHLALLADVSGSMRTSASSGKAEKAL
jgi:hypothetical protein